MTSDNPLVRLFPAAFAEYKPLKRGVHKDIAQRLGRKDRTTLALLGSHLRRIGYLRVLTEGAVRVDLDGQPAGVVTSEDAVHARERLDALVKVEEEKLAMSIAKHYREKVRRRGRSEPRRMTVDPGEAATDARQLTPNPGLGRMTVDPRQMTPDPGEVVVVESSKPSSGHGLDDLKRAAQMRRGSRC
jgi:sRNA-binding protein